MVVIVSNLRSSLMFVFSVNVYQRHQAVRQGGRPHCALHCRHRSHTAKRTTLPGKEFQSRPIDHAGSPMDGVETRNRRGTQHKTAAPSREDGTGLQALVVRPRSSPATWPDPDAVVDTRAAVDHLRPGSPVVRDIGSVPSGDREGASRAGLVPALSGSRRIPTARSRTGLLRRHCAGVRHRAVLATPACVSGARRWLVRVPVYRVVFAPASPDSPRRLGSADASPAWLDGECAEFAH